MTTIYIKMYKDEEEVTVTFINDAVCESTKMTKDDLIKYINGDT